MQFFKVKIFLKFEATLGNLVRPHLNEKKNCWFFETGFLSSLGHPTTHSVDQAVQNSKIHLPLPPEC